MDGFRDRIVSGLPFPIFQTSTGMNVKTTALIAAAVFFGLFLCTNPSTTHAQDSIKRRKLPQGNSGIASHYPGDAGISRHKSVVFVENFNDDLKTIVSRWDAVRAEDDLSLSKQVPLRSTGGKSLLVTHTGGRGVGPHLYRRLSPGYKQLHFRFYVKFDRECAPIHHFFHVGGYNPATVWPQGGAGSRPRGDKRFTTGVEPFGENWRWDYYSYWMNMRGSPPRGQFWGNSFIHDESIKVTKGKWQCLELMIKVNDVGSSNGEMAFWLDGRLVSHLGQGFPKGKWVFTRFLPGRGGEGVQWSDAQKKPVTVRFPPGGKPFEGFRWRSDEKLQLNFVWLLCYITKSPRGRTNKICFDDIVVAKEYIGPISPIDE